MGNDSGEATISTIERLKGLFIHPAKHEGDPAENGSRQQSEFLHAVLESLVHPFYVVDANDYTIRLANSAAGFAELDETSTCHALTHRRDKPCSGAECPCPLEIVKKTKKHAQVEHTHYDEHGTARVYAVHCHPIFDEKGKVAEVVEYTIDITERKQAEDGLRRLSSEQQVILDSVPAMIWYKDLQNTVLRVNRAGAESVGMAVEEIEGKSAYDLFPEEAEKYYQDDLEVMETGRPKLGIIEQLQIASGEKTWVRTDKILLRNEHGDATGLIAFVVDITERKRVEDERESLAKFSGENPSPVLRIDRDGTLMYANQAGQPLLNTLGCQEGQPVIDDWQQLVSDVLKSGSVERLEFVCVGRKFALRFVPIGDAGYVNVYGVDITERKQAEEMRAQLEGQLRQAQKMEAVGTLAGGMAHEFNNLLTGIMGYANLALRQAEEGSQLHRDVAHVNDLSEKARDLIRDVLAFSRQQGSVQVVTDVDSLVDRTTTMLRPLIGEEIELEVILSSEPVTARLDLGQMEQVIVNLAVNARDAMPRGGKLTTETANVTPDELDAKRLGDMTSSRYAMITVTDTGCGMDEATRERIYEPFFTTKETGEGTGLGLSVVHGIVEQHGGYVSVESEVGEGTTFRIYLPRTDEEAAAPVTEEGQNDRAARGSETIFVVDDDEHLRTMVARLLSEEGYAVLTAGCASEAENLFAQHGDGVDLLLTDVVMPGPSGLELYASLTEKRSGLKVLYMSGYESSILSEHGVFPADVPFMGKPFDPDTLVQKVREVLSR